MHLVDVVDLLDRQYAFVKRQSGRRWIAAVATYLDALDRDAWLGPVLRDLEREAHGHLGAFGEFELDLIRRLLPLGDELARLVPEIESDVDPRQMDYVDSVANFRAIASGAAACSRPPRLGAERSLATSAAQMSGILHRKLDQLRFYEGDGPVFTRLDYDQRPELADLERRRAELAGEHDTTYRQLVWTGESHPGFALIRLRYLAREIANLAPWGADPGNKELVLEIFRQRFPISWLMAVDSLTNRNYSSAFGETLRASPEEEENVLRVAAEELDLLNEEVRRRVGSARSKYALVERFRQRCEWYDSRHLRDLASASRTPEEDLTDALARFLFDSGMNPISKPMTGRLQPDLLDPTAADGFYVEAKQYVEANRGYLIKGIWQAHDTLATLRSSGYAVREAFYVIFRRDGPRYVFPEAIRGEGWVLFPVLVDLSPNIGSRAKRRIADITLDEIFEARPPNLHG